MPCTHETVLSGFYLRGLRAGCSGGESTALRQNRQVVVTEQNKDGAKCGCTVLEGRSTRVCLYFA